MQFLFVWPWSAHNVQMKDHLNMQCPFIWPWSAPHYKWMTFWTSNVPSCGHDLHTLNKANVWISHYFNVRLNISKFIPFYQERVYLWVRWRCQITLMWCTIQTVTSDIHCSVGPRYCSHIVMWSERSSLGQAKYLIYISQNKVFSDLNNLHKLHKLHIVTVHLFLFLLFWYIHKNIHLFML